MQVMHSIGVGQFPKNPPLLRAAVCYERRPVWSL